MNSNAHLVNQLALSLVPIALKTLKRLKAEKVEASIQLPTKRAKGQRARVFTILVRHNGEAVEEGMLVNLATDVLKAVIKEANAVQAVQVRSRGLKAFVPNV